MLQAILNDHRPQEWETANYDRSYLLYDVSEHSHSEEYTSVTTPFTEASLTVSSLRRIQNPFQLGQLLVRREQVSHRGQQVTLDLMYHPIDGTDLTQALEYNLDVRRYYSRTDDNHSGSKLPVFFKSLNQAFSQVARRSDKVILVCQVLGNGNSDRTCKTIDSEYMPNYVVVCDQV